MAGILRTTLTGEFEVESASLPGFLVQECPRKANPVIPLPFASECWIDSNKAGKLYVQWTHDIHSTVTKGCPCPAILFLRYDKDSETHMNSNGDQSQCK